jgi:hypothetical protein
MSFHICYDVSNGQFCDYTPQTDFERDSNDSLRPGSYGSTGYSAADQANAHYQSRYQVPSHITNQVHQFNQTIQNDNTGKFDEVTKNLFKDLTKLTNGNLDIEFLPPSMIPPPLPSDLDTPDFKDEIKDFYEQTKDNDFEKTKNKVNQTISNLSKTNPSSEDTFWWNEVRRNHTDANGIITSLPYQRLDKTSFSTPIQSLEGQYVRQEVNNGLASHAQTSFNYMKECRKNKNCGDAQTEVFPVQQSDSRNRMLHNGIKVLDENMAWGYDSGDLANLISSYNIAQSQFNANNPSPSKEQLDMHNTESLFSLDPIDQEINSKGQNIAGFTTWPSYRNSNLNNPVEKSNQHSVDAATCLAAFHLCEMTGDFNDILSQPIMDIGNGPVDPAVLQATAKEKQILELLGMRKKLEGLSFSGVSGAQYLKDMSRYSLIASSAMALNGAMQESDQFKAIAQEVADIGLGLIPGVSIGKDAYELISGKNLVTGKDLTTFERAMAGVGILSLGTSNYVKAAIKGAGKFIKHVPNGTYKYIADGADKIYRAATNSGLNGSAEIVAGGNFIKHVDGGNIGSIADMGQTLSNNSSVIKGWRKNRDILNIEDAATLNQRFIDKGWDAPFKDGTKAIEFTPTKIENYVRVYGNNSKPDGRWLFKAEAVQGLSADEIARKYSLKYPPTHMVDVTVQPGVKVTRGKVAENFGGNEGAVQYLITNDNLDNVFYTNHRPLPIP